MFSLEEFIGSCREVIPHVFEERPLHSLPSISLEQFQRRTRKRILLKPRELVEEEYRDIDAVNIEDMYPVNVKDIGKKEAERTKEAIKEHGIEAIAFYAPFHFHREWGIYVIEDKLYGFAYDVWLANTNINFHKILYLCLIAVLEHELFHFCTEFFSLIAEYFANNPVYIQYTDKSMKPYFPLEEALANAYICLLYTSPSPRDLSTSRMPSSA